MLFSDKELAILRRQLFLKSGWVYSPANFFKIFSASPVGTSPACRGTQSNFPVLGFIHLSCPDPCRDRMHPASLSLLINSDVFIKYRALWLDCRCKSNEKVIIGQKLR